VLGSFCRISSPRFLAECRKRQLYQGSFVLLYSLFFAFVVVFSLFFVVLFCLSASNQNMSSASLNKGEFQMSQSKDAFTLLRVRVTSPGFGLRLVQASPARVSVQGHLYKDNSTRVYQQSPVKSNRENALRIK